ncbi:MAG: hypothetical protein COB02_06635 [Candidatus Cloacimonadota bacterium]|nr:MAG: hypothetical protein COB02_06635 [Candidatus Cloacimonadota bacterium]
MPTYILFLYFIFFQTCFAYDYKIINPDSDWIKTNSSANIVNLLSQLRKTPQDNTLLLHVIHKYLRLKKYTKAQRYLKMAKARQINSHYLLLLEGIYLNRQRKVHPKARKTLYSALLKSAQTESIYYIEYLECLYRESRIKKGIYWIRLALKLFPRNIALLQMSARFWYLSGHHKEAETTLLKAFSLNDGIASINFNISLIYAHLRQHDACIRYLKLASYAGFYKKNLLTLNKEFNFLHNHPQFLLALDKILLNFVDFEQKYRFKKI